jgi:hypothetical protein
MKNQYFGDISDYRKYGLLRCLQGSGLGVTVSWMLTPDDGGNDGKLTDYLDDPDSWRHHDPELFDALRKALSHPRHRKVGAATSFLKGANFVEDVLDGSVDARVAWFDRTVESISSTTLLFLDPDNGLEVASTGRNTRGSEKYIHWEEVSVFWSIGASILIYQHFPRVKRSVFVPRICEKLSEACPGQDPIAIVSGRVLFLLVGQPDYREQLEDCARQAERRWGAQLEIYRSQRNEQ